MTTVEEYNYLKWRPIIDHLGIEDEKKREWLTSYFQQLEDNDPDLDFNTRTFENRLKTGYYEYLMQPLAGITDFSENEIYKNGWYTRIGLGVVSPDPHKHYSFLKFVFECGRDEKLFNRFIKSQWEK